MADVLPWWIVVVVLRGRCDVIIMVVDVYAVYVLLDRLSEVLLLLLFYLFVLIVWSGHLLRWLIRLYLLSLIRDIFGLFFAEALAYEFYLLVYHLYLLELRSAHS